MNKVILEKQAWELYLKINKQFMLVQRGLICRYSNPNDKRKLSRINQKSHERFYRRQGQLFNYSPGGFALSPAQSSGALGQGATI